MSSISGCAGGRSAGKPQQEPRLPPTPHLRQEPLQVDITFCYDFSRSMGDWIPAMKRGARVIDTDLLQSFEKQGLSVGTLRVRALSFADIYVEKDRSLLATRFFLLPDETEQYARHVAAFRPRSGGDVPESGLEALSLAMGGDWNRTDPQRRHIIVLWTDAAAHPPGGRPRPWFLPKSIPGSFSEIQAQWEGGLMDPAARLLILIAPACEPWTTIATRWPDVRLIPFPQDPESPEAPPITTWNDVVSTPAEQLAAHEASRRQRPPQ